MPWGTKETYRIGYQSGLLMELWGTMSNGTLLHHGGSAAFRTSCAIKATSATTGYLRNFGDHEVQGELYIP